MKHVNRDPYQQVQPSFVVNNDKLRAGNRRDFLRDSSAVTAAGLLGLATSSRAVSQQTARDSDRDIIDMSAVGVAQLLEQRKISPTELAEIAIRRIDAVKPLINAMVHFPKAKLLDEARAAEERIAKGEVDWKKQPLTGVPITLKDCLDVRGMPTSSGVPKFRDDIATKDATVVRKLRRAGAIIVGKTNLPALLSAYETDNPVFGRTNNPYDVRCTSGGSSGGEAAIIASGGSWLGVGSDGLGSIRVPAHYCGVPGLRPGWGRVSRAGHKPGPPGAEGGLPDPGLLTVGPFARSVEDLHIALSIMQGPDPLDPNTFPSPLRDYRRTEQKLRGLKVAVWSESEGAVLTAETGIILEQAVKALEKHGVEVTNDKPPLADEIYDISQALYSPFFVDEWESVLKEHGIEEPGIVDRDMMEGLADWAKPYNQDQIEAFQQRLPPLKTGLLTFLQKYDAIISPVTATPAPLHATTFDDIRRLVFVQLPAYVPAIPSGSVPGGFSKGDANQNPLPIGVQVVGRQFREDTVLALMSELEKSLGGWVPPAF